MGNAWTPRRYNIPRPQPCKPPLPPVVPDTSLTCQIDPTEALVMPFETLGLTLSAQDLQTGPSDDLDVSWIASGGTIDGPLTVENNASSDYEWISDGSVGIFLQVFTVSNEFGEECIASSTITVEDMMP